MTLGVMGSEGHQVAAQGVGPRVVVVPKVEQGPGDGWMILWQATLEQGVEAKGGLAVGVRTRAKAPGAIQVLLFEQVVHPPVDGFIHPLGHAHLRRWRGGWLLGRSCRYKERRGGEPQAK